MRVYLIGSLRNVVVQQVAAQLRDAGLEVFDDWQAAGPEADDYWQSYEKARGRTYKEALAGAAAINVYEFDKRNILESDCVVLILPAGRSGHLELGWALGKGIPGYILLDPDVERWDVMYQFADAVFETLDELVEDLK
jgi:nucleoside 2-deoxyribosyltransferase